MTAQGEDNSHLSESCTAKVEIDKVEKTTIEIDSSQDISLDDIDWDEPFELEADTNTQNILQDIADINWDDDVFSESSVISIFQGDHSTEFEGNYHFSNEMLEVLHTKFGLQGFRPGQREMINAVLNGHDCFVLMPTGGGKSLCYQLPAVLNKGVTIVISPLIALISDQVDKLTSLDIRAAHLCCTLSREQSDEVLSKLRWNEPEIDLLYLTPEKIIGSGEVRDVLDLLYKAGKLVRFVMDEVHCLSLWGHDFRPHYKQLSSLREKYSDVQIICFTATATKQVETDVIVNLNLRNVKRFIQSFNRPNIKYLVIDKTEVMPAFEIGMLIRQKFFRKSGIIYCLSRKDCVDLSRYLRSFGIAAKPYHAGLEAKVREITQREWMQDQFHVIVATIAFGMGIDKPDVRFVIHNTIPKSLEAFYQESGRAGRDGEISYSYLFYFYGDVERTMHLMKMDFTKGDTLDGHLDNLEQMVAFANNQIECRRYLQLLNLGEHFDRQLCIQNKETTCDNCENIDENIRNVIDVTKQAKELSILIRDVASTKNITLNMVTKMYKGSKENIIVARKLNLHKCYGMGKLMSRLDIHRILRDLIDRKVLKNHYLTTGEFPIVYVKAGPELPTFLNSPCTKMTIPFSSRRLIENQNLVAEHETLVSFIRTGPANATTKRILTNGIIRRCYENLLDLCRRLAREKNVSISSILHPFAIKRISEVLPGNQEELLRIEHVTIAVFNKFGQQILAAVSEFRNHVQELQNQTSPNREEHYNSALARGHPIPVKRTFTDAFL